jgi:hypothetical protein
MPALTRTWLVGPSALRAALLLRDCAETVQIAGALISIHCRFVRVRNSDFYIFFIYEVQTHIYWLKPLCALAKRRIVAPGAAWNPY